MDEQQTFDLFHRALDVQPPVGAFERLRARLLAGSVAPRRRRAIDLPLPHIRRSVLAVALTIAIAVAATGGLLELHHALHQVVPVGSKGTIVIGSDDSITAEDAAVGLPIQAGEAFAVARVGSVRGYTLKFVTYDDAVNGVHNPQQGQQNVQSMLADPRLLAMLGPTDAAVAWAEVAVANSGSLAIISPVNTYRCLTVAPLCTTAARPSRRNNYFRIAAVDTLSGTAMADFAYDRLGLRTIAVWDDGDDSSITATDGFSTEFARKGGKIVTRQHIAFLGGPPDFRPWLRDAKAAGAQAIYGASLESGCVARGQSQGIFDSSSFYLGAGNLQEIGDPGDGMVFTNCISDAGAMANDHMYATIGVGAAELNPEAQAIIAAYKRAHPDPASISSGTFAGYDCAMILIDAIGRAIDANGGKLPTRLQVLQQLAQTRNFKGLTGTFTFNAAGDPIAPTVQVVQDVGGTWTPFTNVVVPNPTTS